MTQTAVGTQSAQAVAGWSAVSELLTGDIQSAETSRIAVFGLGYVGTVTAACFAGLGHQVTGIDTNPDKVAQLERGDSPVLEPGVEELLASGLGLGRVAATVDIDRVVADSDLALVCVGTPSLANGNIDLRYILAVAGDIADALRRSDKKTYTIVIRSTVLPGSADKVRAVLADSGVVAPDYNVHVVVNPEFLREGQGVEDFLRPPLILVGADDDEAGNRVLSLYDGIEAERQVVPTRVAELVKYANNSWHAVKVTFANEIGVVAKALGVDGVEVMRLLCSDHKLNISSAYMRPGFAWGGSCLPKDVRAVNFAAKSSDVVVPLLSALLPSNGIHTSRLIDLLLDLDRQRIGFVGLAFKPGTDDLRESAMVEVVERMSGKGFQCRIHDQELVPDELVGGNLAFIQRELPHLGQMMGDGLAELVAESDVLVVSKGSDELNALLPACGRGPDSANPLEVVDLVGLPDDVRASVSYRGVAW